MELPLQGTGWIAPIARLMQTHGGPAVSDGQIQASGIGLILGPRLEVNSRLRSGTANY